MNPINIGKISDAAAKQLRVWTESVNIQVSDVDKNANFVSYDNDSKQYYVFSFSVTSPANYSGIVCVTDDALIGESSTSSG
jgi:hypothetical protein